MRKQVQLEEIGKQTPRATSLIPQLQMRGPERLEHMPCPLCPPFYGEMGLGSDTSASWVP